MGSLLSLSTAQQIQNIRPLAVVWDKGCPLKPFIYRSEESWGSIAGLYSIDTVSNLTHILEYKLVSRVLSFMVVASEGTAVDSIKLPTKLPTNSIQLLSINNSQTKGTITCGICLHQPRVHIR